jgi:CPA1 family monovalent cation:H+ antiporter
MTTFQLVALLLALTAGAAYLNARFWRLPASVALMASALVVTAVVLALEHTKAIDITQEVRDAVDKLDFGNTLLHGMLGLLLFAGALHVDVSSLGAEKVAVGLLAVVGTLLSTGLVGIPAYYAMSALGHPVGLIDALLFGALIAPTDPIAVLSMLKTVNAPRRLEVRIAGESLFNDGIGVVIFTVLLGIEQGTGATFGDALLLFVREALGGAAFGLVTGYLTLRLLRTIDDYTTEVLLTLALVVAGYTSAELLHLSAPIGAVVAGLVIGNRGPAALSELSKTHVDLLWKLIDEILNAVLFVMVGFMLILVPLSREVIAIAILAIPISLGARFLSVAASSSIWPAVRRSIPHSIPILTWGGLRGGLSIAMALALPPSASRDTILVMTYAVVAFSILVQGLTFGRLLRHYGIGDPGESA